jgi:excisionase family DNA binding protein
MTPADAAALLGVSPVTIRNWARQGKLPAHITAGGHRRFDYQELQRFAHRNGMTLLHTQHGPLRILVVEDDRQFAAFVATVLQDLHPAPRIEHAYDGFEAGLKLDRFKPDLLLLDLMLPGVDGFSICQRVRADPELRSLRIVAITGYASADNLQRIFAAGANACLGKPFRKEQLLQAVDEQAEQAKQNPSPGVQPGAPE